MPGWNWWFCWCWRGKYIGSNWFGRTDISNMFTGDKNVVLGYIDNMLSESTLNQLIKAKSWGATFGALSNQELGLLERSATVLNKWAIRDDVSGKLEGFSVPDEVVVAEPKKMRDKFKQLSLQNHRPNHQVLIISITQSTPVLVHLVVPSHYQLIVNHIQDNLCKRNFHVHKYRQY